MSRSFLPRAVFKSSSGPENADQAAHASSLRTIAIIALVAGGFGLLIGLPTHATNRTVVKVD